jgi:hypothetical protein
MSDTPFRRLLLATEHGEFDRGAEALGLALARHCALPLAAVLPLTSNAEFESVAPAWAARLDAAASRDREALLADAAQAGVSLDVMVRRGPEPYAEIVAEARTRGTDLLVIRRRGQRSFLANLLVGEMVSKVVAHAPCSVLVVPRDGVMWQHRVLLGLDPLGVDPQAVRRTALLAAACGLPMLVVAVTAADSQQAKAQAGATIDAAVAEAGALGVAATGELRSGRTHQALLDAAAACGADLIVIGRHQGGGLPRAWLGGVAQKVLGLAACPVLVHVPGPDPVAGDPS